MSWITQIARRCGIPPVPVVLMLLFAALPCQAAESSPDAPHRINTVAVMPMEILGTGEHKGQEDDLGKIASECLTTSLSRSRMLTVVERAKIAHVLDEMEFGPSGKETSGVVHKLGLLVGADAVIVGSVSRLHKELRIDCRMVAVADGTILASASAYSGHDLKTLSHAADQVASVFVKAAGNRVESGLGKAGSLEVSVVTRPADHGDLVSVMPGDSLPSGAKYKIVLTPHQDGYAYIFQVDSHGGVFQLFPMEHFADNWVGNVNPLKAGHTTVLPASDKVFVLDSSRGQERILVYFSSTPDPQMETIGASLRTGKKVGARGLELLQSAARSRGLGAIVADHETAIPWIGSGVLPLKGKSFGIAQERGAFMLDFNHR